MCLTVNPLTILSYLFKTIIYTCKLAIIVKRHKIDIVYSNTIKSNIYGACLKLITNSKTVWHARDNVKRNTVTRLLTRSSDIIICVSNYIYEQVNTPICKKTIIYGSIDANKWLNPSIFSIPLKEELRLPPKTMLVAMVGQITRWKNHIDFIEAAPIIIQHISNVHFLIIGDDLSGKEMDYKIQLQQRIKKLGVANFFTFMGHRNDIKEVVSQVELLIHTAVNEPLGRVVIEAMALEKPVIAYNNGGPAEIIIDQQTGFLVEAGDLGALAEKAILLLNSKEIRIKLGKNGRKRVLEKFEVNRYITEMELLFSSL